MSRSGQAALTAAFVFSGGALWADVTPDEVWLSWQNLAQSQGQKLTADSTETAGDTLTVKGITLTMNGEFGTGSATLPEVQLQDNGDGTVGILLPDSLPVHLSLPKDTAEAKPAVIDLTVAAPDAEITASGVPESINYAKTLPKLDVTAKGQNGAGQMDVTLKMTQVVGKYLSEAAESGQNLSGEFSAASMDLMATGNGDTGNTDINLSLSDLGGKLELTGLSTDSNVPIDAALDAGLTFDGSLTYGIGSLVVSGMDAGKPMKLAGTLGGGSLILGFDAAKFHYEALNKALALNVAGTDQTSGGAFTFAGSMADFSSSLDIKGQGWSKSGDFAAALKTGLIMAGSAALGSTNVDFAGGPADKPVKFKGTLAGVQTDFALSAAQITSNLGAKAISVTLASPDIPLPEVSVDLGELAFGLVLPAAKSDKPAPFSYLTKIVDLKLPEGLWAMLDPAASLSHDAASLIIDTSGTVTMTKDLMEDAMALENGPPAAAPGLLNSLDIPQILLRALGAEVTAKGAFTFDNSDMVTIQGVPLPTGKIDIKATGVNALIDKLVALGLVPQEQALQGRMMVSMFANTSATADEITSTLEFKDKHFFANGQQLQ